jgi:hypothetical protein
MKIFQHMLGLNTKPDWEALGFDSRFRLVTTGGLWRKSNRNKRGLAKPDERKIRQTARSLASKNQLGCIDIEHWGDQSRYIQVADIINDEEPGLSWGFYNIRMPIKNYWSPVRQWREEIKPRTNKAKLKQRTKSNQNWKDSCAKWRYREGGKRTPGEAVPVIFASVYDPYQRLEPWEVFARANLQEAKKFNKLTIACLCPEAVDRRIFGKPCTGEMMETYLSVAGEYADAAFIFRSGRRIDIEKQEWWTVLKDYAKKGKR